MNSLPSGLAPEMLGLEFQPRTAVVACRRPAIAAEDVARLAASLPPGIRPPVDHWTGPLALRPAHVLISYGAMSLNTQVIPILNALGPAGARSVAILAPLVTDEALATLLVNDAAGVLAGRIVPLELVVPEFHAGEVVEAIAGWLGTPAWDGRAEHVVLRRLKSIRVTGDSAHLHLPGLGLVDHLRRLRQAVGR